MINRSFGVFVNGYNDFAVFHACEMLNGSTNGDGDIEIGSDYFSGLTDLGVVVNIACVDCGSAGADCPVERVGELVDELEVFPAFQASSAADHYSAGGQFLFALRLALLLDHFHSELLIL